MKSKHRGVAAKPAPQGGIWQRVLNRIDDWFYRQRIRAREAYLAKAHDVFELEYRLRELERHPRH